MSFSARHTLAVLFTVLSLAVTLSAQSPNTPADKAPRGSVSGRVTIKDKGAVGVAVSLRKSEVNPYEQHLKAITDHDGFYRITNVPPGSYEVAPSAPAFVLADNNQRGKSVVVGEDENVEGINFSLVRGGVITGKVTDADGRPVIQQQINLFLADPPVQQQQQAQRQVFPTANVQTDDRGIYRMYGLRAGRYKVATGRGDDVFMVGFSQSRTSYRQVFHPDVTDQAKATIVEVSEGSEATNIDIKLGPSLQTFSVSGRVIDSENGLPAPNIYFGLQRMSGQRGEFINNALSSNAQGDFFADGLIPGKYQIFLFQEMSADLRAESITVDVVDQDVDNVLIKLTKGASLTGVVVLESEDKAALQQLLQMRLMAYVLATPGAGSTFGRSASSLISPDGSFRLGGLPGGTVNVSLNSAMGPFDLKGFAISRIEREGVVLQRGIEVKEGEQIGGLRVFVAHGNGSIRGVVKLENGSLPAGAQMFVRLMRPGETSSGLRGSQVDSRGHFLMEGIPPGNYEVVVQFFGSGVTQPRVAKREVSVQDGIVTDIMITLDLSTPPKP